MTKEYKWCSIDAEGDVGNAGLLGVAFYSDMTQEYITNHDSIRQYLLAHAERGYTFVAHNASYDIPVIFWQLDIPVKITYYEGRFNHGSWKYDDKGNCAQVWDSSCISGIKPLAKLGKGIGIEKWSTPSKLSGKDIDHYKWKCDKHDVWECIPCYAIRDAEIPYRFMVSLTALLKGWGVEPKRSIAGIAVETWKALEHPEPVEIKDRKIIALARESYYGGRVETYKLGMLSPCYTADITSAYPYAMQNTEFPSPQHMVYVTDMRPERAPLDKEGVAEVDISVPAMYVPPLPYALKGERVFPVGRLRGSWTLHELRYAVSLGCKINHVYRCAFATENIKPFDTFIGVLWELRQAYLKEKDPRSLFAKLVMNNLYGRLGMRDNLERRTIERFPPDRNISELRGYAWYHIDGRLYREREVNTYPSKQWLNVLWASQITAAIRVLLHQYQTLQGDGLIYTDTDSIFSRNPIIGTGEGLGQLKADGQYEQAVIAGPKLYALLQYEHDMSESWTTERCDKHDTKRCNECRWLAKAKSVPRHLAYEFLRDDSVSFARPVKPTESGKTGQLAGQWFDTTRSKHLRPHRRTPVDPAVLESDYGFSDTLPPVIGPISS